MFPLDSWVYPALERLAALGYLQTAYLGIRPWTRMECARLLEEADDGMRFQGDGVEDEAHFQVEAGKRGIAAGNKKAEKNATGNNAEGEAATLLPRCRLNSATRLAA